MSNMIELLIIVGVIAFQTFTGYIGNKYLGAILPIAFLLLVGFIVVSGNFSLTFRNIVMPLIGLLTLVGIYEGGKESKKKKMKKELDKMKATDYKNKD